MLHQKRGDVQDGRFVERLIAAIEGERAAATIPAQSKSPAPRLRKPLTSREIDILELLSKRLRDKEIAAELAIAPSTVNDHLKRIYQKLDAHTRREAVERAMNLKIPHNVSLTLIFSMVIGFTMVAQWTKRRDVVVRMERHGQPWLPLPRRREQKWGELGALITQSSRVAGANEAETSITSGQYFYTFNLRKAWQITG